MKDKIIIGNVVIDLSSYSGKDNYSDGPIEEEIMNRLLSGEDERDILENDNRYPILYHFTRERENILSWYPFSGNERVLEVGAGCGAITGILCKKCKEVTAVELSLTRSKINALRHSNYSNLRILVQNIMDIPQTNEYDIITLIGVMEYSELYIKTESPFVDLLLFLKGMLKQNGHILLAIENKFGLKYFLGAREEHHWKINEGLYGYPNNGPQTFSRKGLQQLINKSGFNEFHIYTAWPDYKIPYQLKKIDEKSDIELRYEAPDYGEYEIHTASVLKVMKQLAIDGLDSELCNSFFVDIGSQQKEYPSDVLFASSRNDKFACKTLIYYGKKIVKQPILDSSEFLQLIDEGTSLLDGKLGSVLVQKSNIENNGRVSSWLHGRTVSSIIEENKDLRKEIFNRYVEMLENLSTNRLDFRNSVFVGHDFSGLQLIYPAPVDIVFDNIMSINSEWTFFDTEWVLKDTVPLRYIVWRAIYLFEEKTGHSARDLWSMFQPEESELELYKKMEIQFNKYAYGGHSPYTYNQRYFATQCSLTDLINKINEILQINYALQQENKTAWLQFSEREIQLDELRKKILELEEENQKNKRYIEEVNNLWDMKIRRKIGKIPD